MSKEMMQSILFSVVVTLLVCFLILFASVRFRSQVFELYYFLTKQFETSYTGVISHSQHGLLSTLLKKLEVTILGQF